MEEIYQQEGYEDDYLQEKGDEQEDYSGEDFLNEDYVK